MRNPPSIRVMGNIPREPGENARKHAKANGSLCLGERAHARNRIFPQRLRQVVLTNGRWIPQLYAVPAHSFLQS